MNLSSSSSSSDYGSSSESEDEQTDLSVPKPPSLVKHESEKLKSNERTTLSLKGPIDDEITKDTIHTSHANTSLHNDLECDNADIEEEEEDDDDDDIEWEDADSIEVDVNQKHDDIFSQSQNLSSIDKNNSDPSLLYRSMPSKEVCINFDNSDSEQQKNATIVQTQKPKRRSVKKRKRNINLKKVPNKLKKLALEIHRAHLLTLTSRTNQLSKICSHEELMHIAFSLIPSKFHMYTDKINDSVKYSSDESPLGRIVPSIDIVNEFIQWFCDFVNNVKSRRRRNNNTKPASKKSNATRNSGNKRKRKRAQTPTHQFEGHGILQLKEMSDLILYLSPSYDPGISERERYVSPHEKAQLFIVFTRSIGWRTRYVTVLEPIGPHINVNHPLLAPSLKDFFLLFHKKALSSEVGDVSLERTQERKKARTKHANINKNSGQKDQQKSDNELSDNQKICKDALAWAEILVQYPPSRTRAKKIDKYDAVALGTHANCKWMHTDIARELVNEPFLAESILELVHKSESVKTKNIHRVKKLPLAYALAVEHPSNPNKFSCGITSRAMIDKAEYTDVTAMYANSWSISQKLRGASNKEIISNDNSFNVWWESTLLKFNRQNEQLSHRSLSGGNTNSNMKVRQTNDQKQSKIASTPNDVVDLTESKTGTERFSKEKNELTELRKETIPTSKAAFKNHPVYAIPSIFKKAEVLAPDAKTRICGTFKGELIYRRSDVSEAFTSKKWLYLGRKVKDSQIPFPVKKVTARKKPVTSNFQRMDSYGINIDDQTNDPKLMNLTKCGESDSEDCLYGVWQTNAWSPPRIMPEDPIPMNEHKNVELELLNPGLRHLEEKQISIVAKQLGVPYAPCLIGFEGHGGKRTPTIKGIVVHEHNVELLLEAHTEWESQNLEKTHRYRHREVCKRWKKIIFGLLTKERLEKEYSLNSS